MIQLTGKSVRRRFKIETLESNHVFIEMFSIWERRLNGLDSVGSDRQSLASKSLEIDNYLETMKVSEWCRRTWKTVKAL